MDVRNDPVSLLFYLQRLKGFENMNNTGTGRHIENDSLHVRLLQKAAGLIRRRPNYTKAPIMQSLTKSNK
jgi:hypothetical protein